MIAVIASRRDVDAIDLVARWSKYGARLLMPDDLCKPGWRFEPGRPEEGMAVIDGAPVRVRHIGGVLVRLGAIDGSDLPQLAPGDRRYAAAEMTAFLISWLSELTCPVINRPSGSCLAGPNWGPEDWCLLAHQAGMRTDSMCLSVGLESESRTIHGSGHASIGDHTETVALIGESIFGGGDPVLRGQARRLANLADVEYLSVGFRIDQEGASFAWADTWPDLSNDRIADALLEWLRPVDDESLEVAM